MLIDIVIPEVLVYLELRCLGITISYTRITFDYLAIAILQLFQERHLERSRAG